MENNNINNAMPTGGGSWEPVDGKSAGIDLASLKPGVPVRGADGQMYCMYPQGAPKINNAYGQPVSSVPIPAGVVQMPPIVQPIALVPYATQNQPMLQYDPYATPFDNKQPASETRYTKKPYKKVSLALIIVLCVGILALLLLPIVGGKSIVTSEDGEEVAYSSNGIDMLMSLLSSNGKLFDNFMSEDAPEGVSTFAMLSAGCFLAVLGLFIGLLIKYIAKYRKPSTPRPNTLSVAALIAFILSCVGIFALTKLEVEDVVTAQMSGGAILAVAISIASFCIPYGARKNAYTLENPYQRTDPTKAFNDAGDPKKVYIINK